MVFWFAGLSIIAVSLVFDSPNLDYRLVMVGAVLPSIESLTGAPWILHTLVAPVVISSLVALGLRGKRLAQRKWIGLPIGLFIHLVLDGTWTQTKLFWWPVFGNVLGEGRTPELSRGVLLVVMELVGVAALWWVWSTNELHIDDNRKRFLTTGRLPRA